MHEEILLVESRQEGIINGVSGEETRDARAFDRKEGDKRGVSTLSQQQHGLDGLR
jgi:hypothetical protein